MRAWDDDLQDIPNLWYDGRRGGCGGPGLATSAVREYQFHEIYRRELALWDANPVWRDGKPLHEWLFENREKYLGKPRSELRCVEVLRGLNIAGVLRAYTAFDYSLMRDFLDAHPEVRSVFDPFAGWGERMLCCADRGRRYLGRDVNDRLAYGYFRMIHDLGLSNASFEVGDSTVDDVDGAFDAVITCPPYGETERYTDVGMDGLGDADFARAWDAVVAHCPDASWFCVQTNRAYRGLFLDGLEAHGYALDSELCYRGRKRVSHMNRRADGTPTKTERETMLVCRRV